MAQKIDRFKASKKAYLGHVTRALNSLDDELRKDRSDIEAVKQLVEKIESKYVKVEELSNKIQEASDDVVDIEAEVNSMDTLLDRVIEIKSKAKAELKKVEDDVEHSPRKEYAGARRDAHNESIQLPKLQLSKFSGEIEEYREFMDMFLVTIDRNKRLEDVEKLMYLKTYVEGDAAKLLAGLARTDANYAIAMELLDINYGNEEVLINNHVSKLINLDKQDEKDKSSLRILFNKVTKHVRELESLNITSEMYSVFLVPIVLSKLAEDIRKTWAREKEKGIEMLLKLIQSEVETIEASDRIQQAFKVEDSKYQKEPSYSKSSKPWDKSYSKQSIPAAHALSIQTRKPFCIFCPGKEDHYADECSKAEKMTQKDVKSILMKENACLCCLKKGHRIVDCRQRRWLKCKKCSATSHHTLLHEDRKDSSKVNQGVLTACAEPRSKSMMPQGIGRIEGPNGEQIEVSVMLDICSDKNFIKEAVAKKVGLQGHLEGMGITGIMGNTDKHKPRRIFSTVLKNRHHLEKFNTVEMVEVPEICIPFTRPAVSEKVLNSKYLRHLQLADDYSKEKYRSPDVLIGLPSYWSIVSGKVRRSKKGPVAMESMLGWVLVSDSTNDSSNVVSMLISTQESNKINENLKRFWEIEELGGEKMMKGKWTKEETDVYTHFEENIKYDDEVGKYEVKLPLIEESCIANNKGVAKRRVSSLKHRLKGNKELDQKYRQAMGEYISNGYAEKVIEEEEPQNCYYIPNHLVIKEDRVSTKVRLVFDASSNEKQEKSLNEGLHKGPALQPMMNSVTIRFRLHNVALNADINKMYLMILLFKGDRDMLRFFWEDEETHQIVTYRNTVLPFGLRCSPFLAIATVQHHLKKYEERYPKIVKELRENMYMDDLLTGAETEEEAIQMYREACQIMKEGGFELMKWKSNRSKLIEVFKKDNVSSPVAQKTIDEDKTEDCSSKLLGIYWNAITDKFQFKGEELIKLTLETRATKRNILKIAPRLYDPMGWINPYVVRIKMLFQSVWEHGLEWDENLPPELEKKWRMWVEELKDINSVEIPRRYSNPNSIIKERELHVFGDASEAAYGAVGYLKSYYEEGTSSTNLVYAKSKVAPVKKVTLPRLELLAAEMSAKMSQYLAQELKLDNLELFLWTDSQIALHWLKGTNKQWKTFVSNRVQRIQQMSDPGSWRWCPGVSNPADLVSRGMNLKELSTSELWLHGPSWLQESKEEYPKAELKIEHPQEALAERKEKLVVCFVQNSQKADAESLAGKLVKPNDYSQLKKLVKTTAYITRYMHNIAHKPGSRKSEPLNITDLEAAERYWIQEIQAENFPEEVATLKNGGEVRKDSKLVKLTPYYDEEDGLIKMKGRIQYAEISEDEKHPIILPAKSYIVKLIIEEVHRKQLHAGINQTLVALRNKFWVIKARALVRRVVKSCIMCRKYAPVRLQVPMAPIPRDRITRAYPFQVIGVDFTGPVYVVTKEGHCNKSYIALFTCATMRAVHIELVEDMTTDSFLRAFRRFVSRRGMCSVIYSDNALTFKKASKLLKQYHEIMKGKKFQNYLLDNKIEWKFIVERAPWWGGFYERLMRTLKQPLKKVLGRSSLTTDEMQTILTEVEAMVNSRPLTFISDEPEETSYLTPASFLIGREVTSIPVRPAKGKEPGTRSRKELNQMLIQQNKYLNQIWKMWREEYVRNLGTVPTKPKENNKLKPGELVMVTDHNNPRCKWQVGVVDRVKEGRDGIIRRCWIKTATSILPRPVQHVARLEMDSMEDFKEYRV